MALSSAFLDELRARTPLAAIIGRRVRLARSGKQWKGCCPFHGEKSPSFYVYDDGYHCFGCGAHGDAITFIMQSQGLMFMEAVNQLAAEAGLEVPKPTPEAAEAERRRLDVVGVLEAVQAHYQQRLTMPDGQVARDYLTGRGLADETVARFGLGWAGERGGMTAALRQQGIELDQLMEAGLVRRDEETGRTFELFSNRIMFPIRDRRGTIISFGGRILGAGQPKYVNGPETAVFSKRRNLYGLDMARDGVRNGATLIVVEGYMDVCAATQAGFAGTIAPLGTALTQDQLDQMWRVSPCPVLCFDGDSAGARAASRVMQLALPMLTPERSLKFATLPSGDDPDSLVRKGGASAFQAVLDVARMPSDALFDMLRSAAGDATPEQRAALRSHIIDACGRILDKSLAGEYRRVLLDRLFISRSKPAPQTKRQDRRRDGPTLLTGAGAALPRPTLHLDGTTTERTRILVAILLLHPFLLPEVSTAFGNLSLDSPLARLRHEMDIWLDMRVENGESLDSASLMDHLTQSGLSSAVQDVMARGGMPLVTCANSDAMPATVAAAWWHMFGFLNAGQLREEVALAEADVRQNWTPETVRRHLALIDALQKVQRGEPDGVGLVDA
jgi:DNA primase